MNHQPYREWLVSEETLSAEQDKSLQVHLASCSECSQLQASWKDLEIILKDAPQVGPASGFTLRWRARLDHHQSRRQAQWSWVSIGMTGLLVAVLTVLLVYEVWTLIQDPQPFIMLWLDRAVAILANYYILQNIFKSTAWLNPITIFMGTSLLVGMVSFMSVLWLSAYRKLSLAWRAE
jgi:hypothetical protein